MKALIPALVLLFFGCIIHAQDAESKKYTAHLNLQYYEGPDFDSLNHRLNLLVPSGIKNPPMLVWVGGGAWSKVNRQVEMDLAGKFADQGIAVATVGHRLSAATWSDSSLVPDIKHPQHVIDIARAVNFLIKHAEDFGFSSTNFFVGGFSSGAHLVALLTLDHRYLSQQGLSKDLIKGVIPIAGTFDIPHYYQVLTEAYGEQFAQKHISGVFGQSDAEMASASPTNFLQADHTPMLMISGRDMLRYHLLFEEKLREADYRSVQALNLHNYGHGELWRHLSNDENSKYRNLILEFIHENSQHIAQ